MDIVRQTPAINTDIFQLGDVIYAKHSSWENGKCGLVTGINKNELCVQYQPEVANIRNHFFIKIEEIVDKQWLIRWTRDLTEVKELTKEDE